MSGYRWRGDTPRHEAARRQADARWAHDQRVTAQRARRATKPPPVTVPAKGTPA